MFGGPLSLDCTTCCGSPYTLCVTTKACQCFLGLTSFLNGCSVRFQGPNGEDETIVLATSSHQACISSPAAGTWTVTVSHAHYTPAAANVPVTAGVNATATIGLYLAYATIHYSDDFGSCDIAIDGVCDGSATYAYTRADSLVCVTCPGDVVRAVPGSNTVDVLITASWQPDTTGDNLRICVGRKLFYGSFWYDDCAATDSRGDELPIPSTLACGAFTYHAAAWSVAVSLASPTGSDAIPGVSYWPDFGTAFTVSLS